MADAGSVTLCRHCASLPLAEVGSHIAGPCGVSGPIELSSCGLRSMGSPGPKKRGTAGPVIAVRKGHRGRGHLPFVGTNATELHERFKPNCSQTFQGRNWLPLS